ncbi:uncharacterized protein [Aegilops tauschii subsp. strangulata]|uniref:uncharacterized protein n=1 Tax=Aegilops tauschii subsp. strangulata TaxID=200361 RepID=UPI003CC8AFAA
MSQPDTDATNQALAAAKECQDAEAAKAKLPLATAADGSRTSAGSFSLTSLHAQAVGLHSIKGHVPVELALDTGVHRQWRTFFRAACRKYALLDHLDFDAPDAPNPEWSLLDATVVSWLYGSVSLSILNAIMTPGDDPLAVDLWNSINGLFNDHKINRQLHLTAELNDVKMGEMSMADYLQKVKSLSDGLADLGAPVDDAEMVVHCLNGLSEQYESAADLISLMPGMTFAQCRLLLALQDMKRKNCHARNSDTALFTNTGNPGKAPGKGKKKKKAAAGVTKEIIPAPATPQAATPSWPSPQHPWNGAIQMWPYGQGGLLSRAPPGYAPDPSYAPRHTPSLHAFYAQNPYGLAPSLAALMHQFQTMGLQAPSREWVMDTGASSHIASDPGPRFSDAIASELSTPSALPLPASHKPSSSSMQHSGTVGLGILGGPSWSH